MSETHTSSPAATDTPERTIDILSFERQWPQHVPAKEEAITCQFQISTARYYQMLNAIIDTAAALHYDPMLVGRLRRTREKQQHRTAPATTHRTPHTTPTKN